MKPKLGLKSVRLSPDGREIGSNITSGLLLEKRVHKNDKNAIGDKELAKILHGDFETSLI